MFIVWCKNIIINSVGAYFSTILELYLNLRLDTCPNGVIEKDGRIKTLLRQIFSGQTDSLGWVYLVHKNQKKKNRMKKWGKNVTWEGYCYLLTLFHFNMSEATALKIENPLFLSGPISLTLSWMINVLWILST